MGIWGGGSYTLVSRSLRLKDLLGPVTRVKKKKKKSGGRWSAGTIAAAAASSLLSVQVPEGP